MRDPSSSNPTIQFLAVRRLLLPQTPNKTPTPPTEYLTDFRSLHYTAFSFEVRLPLLSRTLSVDSGG